MGGGPGGRPRRYRILPLSLPAEQPESRSDLDRSISLTGGRIQAILDAATEAATKIRADARQDAEREADRVTLRRIGQLAELTDSLIERAESLRREADELSRAMQDALRELAAMPADGSGPQQGSEPPAAVSRSGASTPGLEAAELPPRAPQGARETPAMRAARMAIDGSAREEIAASLSRDYAIRDPEPILNEVLGREG